MFALFRMAGDEELRALLGEYGRPAIFTKAASWNGLGLGADRLLYRFMNEE